MFALTDPVLVWNDVLLRGFGARSALPPKASRAMAIVHTSIFDAVNSIHGAYTPYRVMVSAHPKASVDAAVAGPAQTSLFGLVPNAGHRDQRRFFSRVVIRAKRSWETQGVKVGVEVATKILAIRSNDGANQSPAPFVGNNTDGQWRPTPPANWREGCFP